MTSSSRQLCFCSSQPKLSNIIHHFQQQNILNFETFPTKYLKLWNKISQFFAILGQMEIDDDLKVFYEEIITKFVFIN